MKPLRKKKKIVIHHNRKLFWVIILLLVILIALIYFIVKGNVSEVVCVPVCGCHPTECVLQEEALNCPGVFCTEECRAGTLDCGQGSCEFVGGECMAVIKQ